LVSPHSPQAATLRRRLASLLYEALLLLGVLALTFMVPYLILGVAWGVQVPGAVLWLHIFLVLGAYFGWYWLHGGQTLAMQTWRIRVVDAVSGAPLTRGQAALRYALTWPSVLFFGAGLIWALLDRDRQFLHDRLARTRVVFLG
jgi:uncharacterized RDD family membrane protein YckC